MTRALCLRADRTFSLEERDGRRPPAPGDVVVRPTAVGVCGTDISIITGALPCRLPRVLGHEIAGVVDDVGRDVVGLAPGTRVAVNPTGYCGTCAACAAGRTAVCAGKADREVGISVDGGLATELRVEERYVHRVPDVLPDAAVALVEPLACVMHAASCLAGDDVLVVGAGPIGLVAATYLASTGATVALLETSPFRRAAAAERMPGAEVAAAMPGRRFAAILDTASAGLPALLDLVEDGGTVVLMGCRPREAAAFDPFELTRRNVTLRGSCDYDAADFGRALDRAPGLGLERLVTHSVPIEDYERLPALLGLAAGDYAALKVVMRPNG